MTSTTFTVLLVCFLVITCVNKVYTLTSDATLVSSMSEACSACPCSTYWCFSAGTSNADIVEACNVTTETGGAQPALGLDFMPSQTEPITFTFQAPTNCAMSGLCKDGILSTLTLKIERKCTDTSSLDPGDAVNYCADERIQAFSLLRPTVDFLSISPGQWADRSDFAVDAFKGAPGGIWNDTDSLTMTDLMTGVKFELVVSTTNFFSGARPHIACATLEMEYSYPPPVATPTSSPTSVPTVPPTSVPSTSPTVQPSQSPIDPTEQPTAAPSQPAL